MQFVKIFIVPLHISFHKLTLKFKKFKETSKCTNLRNGAAMLFHVLFLFAYLAFWQTFQVYFHLYKAKNMNNNAYFINIILDLGLGSQMNFKKAQKLKIKSYA